MSQSPHRSIRPSGMYAPTTYDAAMRAGSVMFVAGQVAKDEHGVLVSPGDTEAQVAVIYDNLDKILREAGAKREYVIKVTTFLVAGADAAVAGAARLAFFGEHRPPHTGIIVGLPEGVQLEVEAVVAFPESAT